jgi:hypothetical protein
MEENPALKPNQKPLKDCDPLWITHRDKNVGIMIRCPLEDCKCGGGTFLTFFWSHPSRSPRNITGTTFEDISFETNLSGKKYGCDFTGTLKNGVLAWD